VLLDQVVKWEGSGKNAHRVIVPPSPEVLKSVKDVVTAAIGFVPDRGDLITIETLPFEETLNQPPPETVTSAPLGQQSSDPMKTIKSLPQSVWFGTGGVLLLILSAVFVLARRTAKKPVSVETVETPRALPGSAEAHAIESANAESQIEAQMAEREEEQRKADLAALAAIKLPPVKTKKAEVLAKQIRETTKKDSTSSAHVLQTWIHER
jgi:flagellar biosynthesis/type III secretory pathway M-ring protein FliF/YscJ